MIQLKSIILNKNKDELNRESIILFFLRIWETMGRMRGSKLPKSIHFELQKGISRRFFFNGYFFLGKSL